MLFFIKKMPLYKYAQIIMDNSTGLGTVINMIIMDPTNQSSVFLTEYTWVIIDGLNLLTGDPIYIGCTYDPTLGFY